MRALLALALGALAGCAAPQPSLEPPLPYPPAAAARVVRIALEEWRDWGGLVREAGAPQPEASPEADPANFPRVLAYWRAVPDGNGAIPDNRGRYRAVLAGAGGDGQPLWSSPYWSAAFVSWVFAAAGVDAREFPPSATHALYLDGLIADARAFPATAAFVPHAPDEYAPQPGDLVCIDRSQAPLRHWAERLAETGRLRPMHCDIVVRTARANDARTARANDARTARANEVQAAREDGARTARASSLRAARTDGMPSMHDDAAPGVVEAVGGNVLDAVTLTRFPADSAGRLLPSPAGRPPLILVMESRLGRLPPWRTQ